MREMSSQVTLNLKLATTLEFTTKTVINYSVLAVSFLQAEETIAINVKSKFLRCIYIQGYQTTRFGKFLRLKI